MRKIEFTRCFGDKGLTCRKINILYKVIRYYCKIFCRKLIQKMNNILKWPFYKLSGILHREMIYKKYHSSLPKARNFYCMSNKTQWKESLYFDAISNFCAFILYEKSCEWANRRNRNIFTELPLYAWRRSWRKMWTFCAVVDSLSKGSHVERFKITYKWWNEFDAILQIYFIWEQK